jgi:molybdenum cofactor synthesis domain-containing protein
VGKTAGIIIIGDEILSGKVQDYNSFFMAQELWSHGVRLCRISIISDSIDEIAEEVRTYSERFDFVFTSGGIGPTHDDVTIAGVSRGFDVRTVVDPSLREQLEKKQGPLSPEAMKMAEVPEGAEILNDEALSFPLIKFRNIFILPGIPQLLRKKFLAVEKLFDEPLIHLKKVYLNESESEIAPVLNEIVRRYTNVKIGSYPVLDNKEYMVMVTLESLDKTSLYEAMADLLNSVPDTKLMRLEG